MSTCVLFVTNADEAGAPRHVEYLSRSLRKHCRLVIVFGSDGPVCRRLKRKGYLVFVLGNLYSSLSVIQDFQSFFKLFRLLKKLNVDIIHCHSSKAALLGRLAALFLRKPWVYTVHGWGWRGLPFIKYIFVYFVEFIMSYVPNGAYICVATEVAKIAFKALPINRNRIRVIYNGVPDSASSLIGGHLFNESTQIVILMAARVCSAKDHDSLLCAFEKWNNNNSLLQLCGSGTDSSDFISHAQQLAPNSFSRISFLGQRSDVDALIHHADIVVLTSHYEALPLFIIESMRSGKPAIATKLAGLSELIIQNSSGFLVGVGQINEIVEALELLSSPETRKAMGSNARSRYLKYFNAEDKGFEVYNVYKLLL